MSTSHSTTSEPAFPTQAELRALIAEMEANSLAQQLFFDALRFRAIVDLDGVVVALNDYARERRGADVTQILDRPMWEDPLFASDPLWEGRLRSRFAEALSSPTGTIEYEDRVDVPGDGPLIVRVRVATINSAAGYPIGFLVDSSDVGREHRSRELVREQQRLLHVVFERTFQLIAILDANGTIIDVNDAISRIGLTRDVAIGQNLAEISAVEGPERVAEWRRRLAEMHTATEPRRYFDVRERSAQGPRIATDVSMTPVRGDDGALELILLEFRDQTERFEAEERLRESEERFRVLAETLPQMVWTVEADGTIDYLSPGWEEFTGHGPDALMAGAGRTMVHPEDLDTVLRPMPEAGVDDHREFRMRRRDGEWRWMESRARGVVGEDGKVRRWYGATLDVTERRETEELFRAQSQQIEAAAALAGLGSFVWDVPDAVVRMDERCRRIFGTPLDDPAQLDVFVRRVHPDDREQFTREVEHALAAPGPPLKQEFRVLIDRGDGLEERWVASLTTVEFDEHQEPLQMFGAVRDVTHERRQDEARARMQKVEAIGTLVGAVAHDFNNVIGAILTYARVAEAEMAAGEQPVESVAEIARGARRAADILGRLMAFSREEPPRRIRFDCAEIVGEAVALLRPSFSDAITVRVELDPDLPPLDGDPTQIHQVLVNLLTNACQALADTPDATITIGASCLTVDASTAAGVDPGRYVRLTVQDNGPGFAEGSAHRVFDPFFTTKPVGKGTGLGLAAVQSIVRAHGGAVEASEPVAGGALFTLLLPVVADAAEGLPGASIDPELVGASAADAGESPDAEPSDAPRAPRLGPIRVLFVDDEPALVRLAGRAMPYRDVEVSGHTDAAEALSAFRAAPHDFDVLVTDLSMPSMSGFELIDAIHEVRPGFPVVLTSGYLGPADEAGAATRAIDAVLPKPCSIDALAAAVQRVARR